MSNFARMFANGLRFGPQQPPMQQPMRAGGVMPPQGLPMQTGGQQQPMPMMPNGGQMPMQTGGPAPMWRQPQPASRLGALQQRFDQAPYWQAPGGFNFNRR